MNDSLISVRYSRAIFQSALESKKLDSVSKDMILISEICKLAYAREFLDSPVIIPSKKSDVFHKMFEGNVEPITLSLLDLLVKNGRETYLPAIARVFLDETMKHKGITRSYLTSAYKVDEKIKSQVSELISRVFNTKAELEEIIDKDIIGGFILRVDDNYIDASIRNKLSKIRKGLNRSSLQS